MNTGKKNKTVPDLAPIALFVYNRLTHTRRTIESLRSNLLASESELTVFSDGAADPVAEHEVYQVRKYLRDLTGFASVRVVEREGNHGLAKSITEGVTEMCERYGRVIVLEDDLVTSRYFLKFMNQALQRFENKQQVWHISGWNYPVDDKNLPQAFFWRVMNCWGWATWADRWQFFRKEPERLVREWQEDRIYRFNLEGANNFWDQVVRNYQGSMNTWAIFWYATIFENDGLCLNPTRSYVHNIGHDGSGVHCDETDAFSSPLADEAIKQWPKEMLENEEAVARIRAFYRHRRPGLGTRIRNDLARYFKRFVSRLERKSTAR